MGLLEARREAPPDADAEVGYAHDHILRAVTLRVSLRRDYADVLAVIKDVRASLGDDCAEGRHVALAVAEFTLEYPSDPAEYAARDFLDVRLLLDGRHLEEHVRSAPGSR